MLYFLRLTFFQGIVRFQCFLSHTLKKWCYIALKVALWLVIIGEPLLVLYSSGFQLQSSRPPRSAHFACLCCLNTPDSDHQLIRRKFHEWTVFRLTCSLHSVHCSLLPKHEKSVDVYFTSELIYSLIYSRICATPASSHTDETY